MRRPGRPAQVGCGHAGRSRVMRIQRNSSTIFAGELAGRSSAAGSSDGSTRKRSASPMSDPRTLRGTSRTPRRPRGPSRTRVASARPTAGPPAAGSRTAPWPPRCPRMRRKRPRRGSRGTRPANARAPAYARPNAASCSSSRSVSGAAAGGSVAPNRGHHDDNALDERPVSSRRRWRHPQARRNRRSASRCARTDRSIAGRVVSRRTARLVSVPALAANARSVAAT